MTVLLGENFPLALYRRLREAGKEVEHIIPLGQRGLPDAVLRRRLATEELVFLTQDAEFEDIPADFRSRVIISRLPQRLPIRERVEIWFAALERFQERNPQERLFDLLPSGEIVAWEIREFGRVQGGPV